MCGRWWRRLIYLQLLRWRRAIVIVRGEVDVGKGRTIGHRRCRMRRLRHHRRWTRLVTKRHCAVGRRIELQWKKITELDGDRLVFRIRIVENNMFKISNLDCSNTVCLLFTAFYIWKFNYIFQRFNIHLHF